MKLRGSLVLGKNDEKLDILGEEFGHHENGNDKTGYMFLLWPVIQGEEVPLRVQFDPGTVDSYEVTVDDEDVEVISDDLRLDG